MKHLTFLLISTLFASSAPMPIVSIASLPAQIRRANPELQAQKLAIREAQGAALDAGLLANPEVEFSTAAQRASLSQAEIAYFQKFPLSDKRAIAKNLATLAIDEARVNYEMLANAEISRAKLLLGEIAIAREKSAQFSAFLAQQREFHTAIASATKQGEAPLSDVAELDIAMQQTQSEIDQAALEQQLALSQLSVSLGFSPETSLSLHLPALSPLILPAPPRGETAAEQRAQLAIRNAELSLARVKAERVQDIEVGAFGSITRVDDAPIGQREESMVGIKVRMPLAMYAQNRGAIAAATARQQRSIAQIRALRVQLAQQKHAQSMRLNAIQKRYEFFTTHQKVNIEEQLTLARKSYLEGLTPIQNILRLQEQRRACLMQILAIQRDFFTALQAFERIGQVTESTLFPTTTAS